MPCYRTGAVRFEFLSPCACKGVSRAYIMWEKKCVYMAKIKKETKIKREYARLAKHFEGISESKRDMAERLLWNAAFMAITLEELQEKVIAEGVVVTETNGNGFKVTQENPAQKSYNTIIKNYNATIKQLAEICPDVTASNKLMELMADG